MDGIGLLCDAKAAGLTVEADGDVLRIRGPRNAESIARRLLENKGTVLEAIRTQQRPPIPCWAVEDDELVRWFLEKGQHLIPSDPFQLTKWLKITKPDRFKECLLFDISMGPDGARSRTGALQENLRFLKDQLCG